MQSIYQSIPIREGDAMNGQKWAGNALKSQCSHTEAGAVDQKQIISQNISLTNS
jgi:hypothetical protein